jgi:type I restriction-modification system DNA methylase subunit
MSKTYDQGREEIARLCKYFADNRQAFLAPGVKEAHVRLSLIDPLFEALGWDLRNTAMIAPQYREVVTEDSLEIEGQQKAPDYAFRVGTLSKFYTEAKKCGININADPGPAYQLRRYGWSAKVPLSILTDFEEFGVYDCSLRPKPADKASFGRIQYYKSEQYADCWRELWDIFSREAVWAGAYDRYAASKRKRGTSEVDGEFLKEIESWRDELARNIALRNQFLGPDDLNAAVQRTIDRIIFLRMAEDRGSESYGQLLKLCDQPNMYSRFMSKLCKSADEKYNSGLFHFNKEEGTSESLDAITPKLQVDDKVFKPILQSLYFEHGSPYHFGVLPVEILGTVYERFLGKVIRLTPEHRAKVEEKPEVRKAGGVYYTPAYIVDYIVKNTVGKMIAGKSPAQLGGGKNGQPLCVLDMACGSGSFLLGAFQCLLDHCLKWYMEHQPDKFKNEVFKNRRGEWQLAIAEKKRILTTHIFGVDIDAQAVEVSKLSLLLKAMEGETDETVGKSRQLFHERALPNLSNNIKCGNSLIGPDYFSGRLIPDPDEMKRVNPFDWNREFPEAMKSGGFDCVIGNPPYIRIQTMKEWAPLEVEIYKELFSAANAGNYDIYVVFVEKGLNLLNSNGRLGFILPHKFFNSKYGEALRNLLAKGKHLSHIVHFGDQQVFIGATTYTCLFFLEKSSKSEFKFTKVEDLTAWYSNSLASEGTIMAPSINSREWNFIAGKGVALFERLNSLPVKLGDVASIFVGLQTSADKIYVLKGTQLNGGRYVTVEDRNGLKWKLEREVLRPFINDVSLSTFELPVSNHWLVFPYRVENKKVTLIPVPEMIEMFPKTWQYLKENSSLLRNRESGKADNSEWYGYIYRKNLSLFDAPKLIVQVISLFGKYAYDSSGVYFTGGGNGPYYGIRWLESNNFQSIHYLQAVLCSRISDFYLHRVSSPFRGGYWSYGKRFIEQIPIRTISLSNQNDIEFQNQLVKCVEQMFKLTQQLSNSKSESTSMAIKRQVNATESEMNNIIYKLYELTEEEIRIVEDATAR